MLMLLWRLNHNNNTNAITSNDIYEYQNNNTFFNNDTDEQHNAERLLKLIEEVYRWLPLGTIVNNRVLVVHGGVSDSTDLDLIRSLDRGKVILRNYYSYLNYSFKVSELNYCTNEFDKGKLFISINGWLINF